VPRCLLVYLCLDPCVYVLLGFGSFPLCTSMFACLLLCYISMFPCLDLGFAMLYALCGLVLVGLWGHLFVWFAPFRACLDVTTCEIHLRGVGVLDHTFLCSIRCCYACLVCFVILVWLCLLFYIFACLPTCSCMSQCVIHTPIQWNYGHSIQT